MAQNLPLHIDAGATFTREFAFANPAGGAWGADYDCAVKLRDLEGNVALSVVPSFNRTTGAITLTLSAAQTGTLTQDRYRWALELEGDNETLRLLQGRVTVSSEVVR